MLSPKHGPHWPAQDFAPAVMRGHVGSRRWVASHCAALRGVRAMSFWRPGDLEFPREERRRHGGRQGPSTSAEWLDADAERQCAPPVVNLLGGLPVQVQRERLPIHRHRLGILHAVETHRATILCGPTGCGKSTQLPQYLDEAGWTAHGYVIGVTLPRRVAAVSVATRVAQEMGVTLGKHVGYRIRFDSCYSEGETRIEFMTEGVLLREMLSDPLLTRYSVIVVDEAHERSMQLDLLLGLLRKIGRKRPRLRVIVASATLDVEGFVRFFSPSRRSSGLRSEAAALPERKRPRCGWDDETGEFHKQREEDGDWRKLCKDLSQGGIASEELGRDVCVLFVEGRQHPVEIRYLEEPSGDYLETAVGVVMTIHEREGDGDILVFLTGREEIEIAISMIRERLEQVREQTKRLRQKPKPLTALPLHGALPKEAQLKALLPAQQGTRKVVVSTNLAEASVTIDGIVHVVDACLVKADAFCPHNGVSYLNIAPCSRSSARQRAGRAGRTRLGKCYRLLTEAAFSSDALPEQTLPEVARADLKDVVLMLKCLGVDDVSSFEFVTRPPRAAIELALEELYAIGAVDAEARIVEPLGPRMAHGPLPLLLMRLLLLAAEPEYGCSAEAAAICAMLTLREPWLPTQNADRLAACRQSFAVYEGDLVSLLNIFRQYEVYKDNDDDWAKRHFLNKAILERAVRVKRQIEGYLKLLQLPLESCGHEVDRLQRLACAAFFQNAARRLPNVAYRLCRPVDEVRAPHASFHLHPASVLAGVQFDAAADFIVALELVGVGDRACLRHCTRVRPEWLPEVAPHYFRPVRAGAAPTEV